MIGASASFQARALAVGRGLDESVGAGVERTYGDANGVRAPSWAGETARHAGILHRARANVGSVDSAAVGADVKRHAQLVPLGGIPEM